jgi:hypothetical protein
LTLSRGLPPRSVIPITGKGANGTPPVADPGYVTKATLKGSLASTLNFLDEIEATALYPASTRINFNIYPEPTCLISNP